MTKKKEQEAPAPEGFNTDAIRELIKIDTELRELDKRTSTLKLAREAIETKVKDQFSESGVDKITVDGKTVYLRRDTYASPIEGNKEKACAYLKEHGLEFYVNENFNALSISAFVKEHRKEDDTFDLPEGFLDVFKVSDVYRVRTGK